MSKPMSVMLCQLEHHRRLQHFKQTSYKVQKCVDQQCSAIMKQYIKCSESLPLALSHALSLNCHWSSHRSITVCWMLDRLSIRHCLNSSTSHTGC